MQVGPQEQKQSVGYEGYPMANLTGDWDAPGQTSGTREQSPEGMNENTAFLNVKIVIFNAKMANACRSSFGTPFIL